MAAKDAKPAKSTGGAAKKGKSKKAHESYTISGDKAQRKNKSCPKCGPGVFLALHGNRTHCGTCGYTEFLGKK